MAYLSMGEAHRRITEYLDRFFDAVSSQDGPSLSQLLSLSSNSLSLADALNVFQDANRLIKQSDNYSQFGEILVPRFRSLQSYRLGNLVDAYQAFEKSSNAFIQEFRNWESAWALEALYVITYEIRVLAERADKELAFNGKSPEKLKGAGSFLMKVFGVLAVCSSITSLLHFSLLSLFFMFFSLLSLWVNVFGTKNQMIHVFRKL